MCNKSQFGQTSIPFLYSIFHVLSGLPALLSLARMYNPSLPTNKPIPPSQQMETYPGCASSIIWSRDSNSVASDTVATAQCGYVSLVAMKCIKKHQKAIRMHQKASKRHQNASKSIEQSSIRIKKTAKVIKMHQKASKSNQNASKSINKLTKSIEK